MELHPYQVVYFSMGQSDLQPLELQALLAFEKTTGPINLETDIEGLKVDFCSGVRVQVPEGKWRVRVSDAASGLVGFDGELSRRVLVSAEKFLIFWHVEIWHEGELVFEHILDFAEQQVCIFMQGSRLGDAVALFPYLRYFQEYYKCRVVVQPPVALAEVLREYFPDIEQVDGLSDDTYAAYCLAVFQGVRFLVPDDSRLMSPGMTARMMLQLPKYASKVVYNPTGPRVVAEPYVCIAVQASGMIKRWLCPDGWKKVVEYLRGLGYRVLCIDAEKSFTEGAYTVDMPEGAEDFTGMLPLMERINLLAYADFFVGLDSGLSWLADACDVPVVMISGFTLLHAGLDTPYRVINPLVCHGCHADIRFSWKGGCPRHGGTARELECSKRISFEMVRSVIDKLRQDRELL